jgi:hypothetical protein
VGVGLCFDRKITVIRDHSLWQMSAAHKKPTLKPDNVAKKEFAINYELIMYVNI